MGKPGLPTSARFYNEARGVRDAADAAHQRLRSPGYIGFVRSTVAFLYARTIELSLKSCLRHHISDPKFFQKALGHRLDLIVLEADKLGICAKLKLSAEHRKLIDSIGEDYADKWFEYADNSWAKRPDIEQLRSAAESVISEAKFYGRT